MVWNNDPGRVNGGKGYGDVDWLDCFSADRSVDRVYSSLDGGCAQHSLLMALKLILIVSRASQYIVDGRLRFRWELYTDRYSFGHRGDLRYAGCLLDIPPEVADPDKLFHHKLQASTSVGIMPVVPMVVTPQRLVVLCGIKLNGCGPFKVGMIPDERKEAIIRDVHRGKLQRSLLSFRLVLGAFLVLAPLRFGLTFSGRLIALGGDHYGMGGSPDVIFQC